MSLSTRQRKEIQEALMSAFPKKSALEQMLSYELDKNLEAIVGEGSLQEIIFRTVQTAEANGWIEDLIHAAYTTNPGNTKLKTIAQTLETFSQELYHRTNPDCLAIKRHESVLLHNQQLPEKGEIKTRGVNDCEKIGQDYISAETVNMYETNVIDKDLENSNAKLKASKRQLAFAIAGTLDEVDEVKLKAILKLIQQMSGDAFIEIIRVEEGSIRLILDGTPEGLERVKKLFESGQLTKILEHKVEYVEYVEKTVEIKPDNRNTWYHQGNSLRLLGRLEEAVASYDKAVEIKPDDHNAWYNRANPLYNLGRLEEAVASYDRTVEIKPDYQNAWYNRGCALHQLGRLEEAIASYDKAVEIKPDDHEAWYNRGCALHQLGRLDQAVASYDRTVEIKPDYQNAWYNRGCALRQLGRLDQAVASYDRTVEIKSDDHEAWYNRGNALYNSGKLEEAITSYDKAVEIKPDYYEALNNRLNALHQLERLRSKHPFWVKIQKDTAPRGTSVNGRIPERDYLGS